MVGETQLVPDIWDNANSISGTLPILYSAGFKGRKMDKFIPSRKNATKIAFYKPVSEFFFQVSGLRIWFPPIHYVWPWNIDLKILLESVLVKAFLEDLLS